MPYSRIHGEQLWTRKSVFESLMQNQEALMKMSKKFSRKHTQKMTSKALQMQTKEFTKSEDVDLGNNYQTLYQTNYAYRLKVHSIFNKSN